MKAILFLILFAAAAAAQVSPDFFPWLDSPLARDLNIRDEQRAQIRAIVREYRGKLIDLRAAEAKADGEMKDLLGDDPVDARKVNEVIDRLATARSELTRAYSQMSLRLRQALTARQWEELERRAPRVTIQHQTLPAPAPRPGAVQHTPAPAARPPEE